VYTRNVLSNLAGNLPILAATFRGCGDVCRVAVSIFGYDTDDVPATHPQLACNLPATSKPGLPNPVYVALRGIDIWVLYEGLRSVRKRLFHLQYGPRRLDLGIGCIHQRAALLGVYTKKPCGRFQRSAEPSMGCTAVVTQFPHLVRRIGPVGTKKLIACRAFGAHAAKDQRSGGAKFCLRVNKVKRSIYLRYPQSHKMYGINC
jgi:hypothetical protein